ncbi:MAG: hypothetical protein REI12_11070 [Pedobacter sp.]|nr:hypothetical protein [Pedobacter sp.]
MKAFALAIFLMMSSASASTLTTVSEIQGARQEEDILATITSRADRFAYARRLCRPDVDCSISLRLDLAGGAERAICTILSSSGMDRNAQGGFYCRIAETLHFSPVPEASSFIISFRRKTLCEQVAEVATPNGQRSETTIRRAFDVQGAALNNAYQRQLRKHGNFEAILKLTLTIETDGHISAISNEEIGGSFPAGFTDAVIDVVRAFSFCPAADIWHGTHNLNFFPN